MEPSAQPSPFTQAPQSSFSGLPSTQASAFGGSTAPAPSSLFGSNASGNPGSNLFASSVPQSTGFGNTSARPSTSSAFGSSAPGGLFASNQQPANFSFNPNAPVVATSPFQPVTYTAPYVGSYIQPGFSFCTNATPVPYPVKPSQSVSEALIVGYEVEGYKADLVVEFPGKRFKVCSGLVGERAGRVKQVMEGKETGERRLVVDLPVQSDPSLFLQWLHTLDSQSLLNNTKTFDTQIDLLALSTWFEVSPDLHFEAIVLSQTLPYSFNYYTALPQCWDRAFIPLELAIRVMGLYRNVQSSSLFGGGFRNNSIPTQMALEWLGERRCFSPPEISELRNSPEYLNMKRVLQENYCLPHSLDDYLALTKRYPIAIEVFSLSDMFKSLNIL